MLLPLLLFWLPLQVELSCEATQVCCSTKVPPSAYIDIKVWTASTQEKSLVQSMCLQGVHVVCPAINHFKAGLCQDTGGCASVIPAVPCSKQCWQCQHACLVPCPQEDCGLVVEFASFPALLLKLLNLLEEQPSTYVGYTWVCLSCNRMARRC